MSDRVNEARMKVLRLMKHEAWCAYAIDGSCTCEAGQRLIDLLATERATPAVDRCDKIVNNGMGEPTECGRTLPCEYHPAGAVDVEREAREVMRLLDQHGPSIVPHLLDTDDNPGERLRQARARLSGESE